MSYIDNLTPENITDLEDKQLTDHIDNNRKLLKNHNIIVNDDPIQVINTDKQIRIYLSEMIIDITTQIQDIKHISDHLFNHINNCKDLSNGQKPYIYNTCTTSTDIFNKMSKILEDNMKQTDEISYYLEDINNKLNKTRRLYEFIINNIYNYV